MTKYAIATRKTGAILGLSLSVVSTIALAHHGFQSRYDMGKPIWIEGIVERSYFGNPHSELTVKVAADLAIPQPAPTLGPVSSFLSNAALHVPADLRGQTVELELPPTAQYSSLGGRVSVGDRIAAVTIRNCETPHQLNVQWLRLADGSIESRQAAMSYMVEQC
ncbi:hypothetical protein SAMN03159496_00252 [Rhizobium sp. NFR07]|uniref:DUF6152 family protein n=1 Tax=Rhizobium sp. NFR07 TaxID=1566262 RepID=UPI0008E9698F|nr:DUF6152 family protein [Rhizobium sp. NFR07]SFA76968.1 hypothetical protein SAMN03159496_00252 [Rhizobium sp. NFR07]